MDPLIWVTTSSQKVIHWYLFRFSKGISPNMLPFRLLKHLYFSQTAFHCGHHFQELGMISILNRFANIVWTEWLILCLCGSHHGAVWRLAGLWRSASNWRRCRKSRWWTETGPVMSLGQWNGRWWWWWWWWWWFWWWLWIWWWRWLSSDHACLHACK